MSELEMEVDNNRVVQLFVNINKEDNEFVKICSKLAADVTSKSYKIVQLVEDLGIYLVDKTPKQREFGTLILSTVLQSVPETFLESTQLNFITTFYADRLKDHHEVVPAVLKGIVAISKHVNFPEGSCAQLLTALFHNVPCQQQQQADRYVIYNIFENMLIYRANELKAMGIDFVYGVISAMDGERDPRNLLYLFKWIPNFLNTVNLGHLCEEMFEVLSCYFPVDFKVSPQEANNVTRDGLANALSPCLCGVPEFAEFCIPLALEKLESTLRIAKLDSLQLLNNGCQHFSSDMYMQHSNEILSQIQKEVLSNSDSELQTLCLTTLTSIISKLSQSNNTLMFKEILINTSDTLKGNLRPDAKLFESTTKLLLSISKASKASSSFIITEVAPLLTNLYNITKTEEHQILIFKSLIQFVQTYITTQNDHNLLDELSLIPNLCLKTAIDPNPQLRANGLIGLSIILKSLSNELRMTFYESLKVYLTTPQANTVHKAVLICLKSFADVYPDEIKELVSTLQPENLTSMEIYLNSISAICTQPEFLKQVVTIIINNCTNDETAVIGLKTLMDILKEHEGNEALQVFLVENNVITTLLKWISNNKLKLPEMINLSTIFKCIVGAENLDEQKLLISEINNVVTDFKNNKLLVYILYGLISRLRREVLQDFNVMTNLLDVALIKDEENNWQVATELLANMVNKLDNEEGINSFLSELSLRLEESNNVEVNVNITAWILKALIMRGHDKTSDWINKLLKLLEKHESAAIGFKIVMHDEYDSLSVKSLCNKRLLYRQRFFMQVNNILCDNYTSDNKNYLLAIGFMLEEVPEAILKMHFERAIKLIVICMDTCDHPRVLISILATIKSFIINKDELAHKYLEEFIPRLLKLSQFKNSMKVRVISLQCLQSYTDGFVLYKLLPHKSEVTLTLGRCVDDHKRLVRKEAADTRLKWYLIDAPI